MDNDIPSNSNSNGIVVLSLCFYYWILAMKYMHDAHNEQYVFICFVICVVLLFWNLSSIDYIDWLDDDGRECDCECVRAAKEKMGRNKEKLQ